MEKITKPDLSTIPELSELEKHFLKWGQEFEKLLQNSGKSSNFTWRGGLYEEIRTQLSLIVVGHCTFCDGYPIATISKETLEHYFPKKEFPLKAYEWYNLFYCCDKCQSEANKRKFQFTLKPDEASYSFSDYFWFDLDSGELKVLENLKTDNPDAFTKATEFLLRYGISNNPRRNSARKSIFRDIQNHLSAKSAAIDTRERDDFPYRYIYDFCLQLNEK